MTKRTHDHGHHARRPRPRRRDTITLKTRLPELCSSRPFYLVHARLVSPQNTPLIKSLGPVWASITRILGLRYRMYLYTIRNSCHEPIYMTLQ